MSKTEAAISWMENTARNNAHGYDQRYRWGEKGDYDCSSAVITAWQTAGVPVKTRGATYTGNMKAVFLACGFTDVTGRVNLRTGAGLVRGDVLLNTTHHTAMYCGNGLEVEASINEKGTAVGGAPGDQTGREFLIRSYRNFPWNCVLRYAGHLSGRNQEEAISMVRPGRVSQLIWDTPSAMSRSFTARHCRSSRCLRDAEKQHKTFHTFSLFFMFFRCFSPLPAW